MKQHITINQLNELSDKQFNRLYCTFIEPIFLFSEDGAKRKVSELTNIGKMIEILCNSDFGFPNIGKTESSTRDEYIVIGVTSLSGSKELYNKTFEGDF